MIHGLEKLWSIAEAEASRRESNISFVFEPIGLILRRPLKKELYESSPKHARTFAVTGGNGVHFSLLQVNGEITDLSPVVMTVPMNFGNENLIVGQDLEDFLSLGCQVGYSFLELLTYGDSRNEAIYWLTDPDDWFESHKGELGGGEKIGEMKILLGLIRSEIGLSPWEDVEKRLKSLNETYGLHLETDQPD